MKVMVIVKASPASEAGEPPSEALIEAMTQFNEELVKAGILVSGDGLKPSSQGVRIHFSGDKRTMTDGPFAETKELIAGYWVWRVSSMEEAITWAKKCPNPMPDDSDIEIRPFVEFEDLGEGFTPEIQEREASLYAQTIGLHPPRFEELPACKIAGIEKAYTFSTRGNISLQWDEFIKQKENVASICDEPVCYGVCTNADKDGFQYLSGVQINDNTDLPDHFTQVALPTRRYAVFQHQEHLNELCHTMDKIWSKWVIDCGLKIAQAPNFERYTESFNPQTGLGGIEVWIPLQDGNP